jgi:hypothetical protein
MTSSTPRNSRRCRITAAALLVASGAVTAAALGAAAPAGAAPATPSPVTTKAPTWAAIAFSPDSGAYGWATGYTTESGTDSNAVNACTAHGGKQCQIEIGVENQCAALASVNSNTPGTILTAAGEGATLQEAEQNAVGFDGTLITAHCSSEPQATGGGFGKSGPPWHIPVTSTVPAAPGRL